MLANYIKQLRYLVIALTIVSLFAIAPPVLASTYGSHSYDSCDYGGIGCAAAAPAGSGSTASSTNSSSQDSTPADATTLTSKGSNRSMLAVVIGAIILLFILPRSFYAKTLMLFNRNHHGQHHKPNSGSLSDHIPQNAGPSHHNPLLPAHDLHSQAGVVENDEEIINEDETGELLKNRITLDGEQYEDIPPKEPQAKN